MKKRRYKGIGSLLILAISSAYQAAPVPYLTQLEYTDILYDRYQEDEGVVIENNPQLGYLTYKNQKGQIKTRHYYKEEVIVEKQPYDEMEDRIGYLDELFPHFEYDPRDTTLEAIQAGDGIYLKTNKEGQIIYISAYNEYLLRYGKIVAFSFNATGQATLQLADEKGQLYLYEIPVDTPLSKGGKDVTLSSIKIGEWAKILVCEKILGEGMREETVLEILLDPDTRVISQVYRGEVATLDTYRQNLYLQNAQALGKIGWGRDKALLDLHINPYQTPIYKGEQQVSVDYLRRRLTSHIGYVYVAAEAYRGKEQAASLYFSSRYQKTLPPTKVIAASKTEIKLLSGECLQITGNSLLVRGDRLVGRGDILPGDTLQAVVTTNNELAVGIVHHPQAGKNLSVYRGRVQKQAGNESFQVKTFSKLEEYTWCYYPTPQTFTLSPDTIFYDEKGLVIGGRDTFLGYGEDSVLGEVYTVIAEGAQAKLVIKMPYTTEAVKGEVYGITEGLINLKDVYSYQKKENQWQTYSEKNKGITLKLAEQAVILKEGEQVPLSALEEGDRLCIMLEEPLKQGEETVTGYICMVQN